MPRIRLRLLGSDDAGAKVLIDDTLPPADRQAYLEARARELFTTDGDVHFVDEDNDRVAARDMLHGDVVWESFIGNLHREQL